MKKHDLSSIQLAEIFGVSVPTIQHWVKRGCPHIETYQGTRLHRRFNLQDVRVWVKGEQKKYRK